jgi:hypothetical protein
MKQEDIKSVSPFVPLQRYKSYHLYAKELHNNLLTGAVLSLSTLTALKVLSLFRNAFTCLSVASVSSSCFYNSFIGAAPIPAYYSLLLWELFQSSTSWLVQFVFTIQRRRRPSHHLSFTATIVLLLFPVNYFAVYSYMGLASETDVLYY